MPVRLFLTLFVLQYAPAWAQTDVFTGIWQMYTAGNAPFVMELKIGAPEKNMLYPAAITIKSNTFYGEYQLLLVKKNAWQLAISKNKFAAAEKPFHLDMLPLNGSFDLRRNTKEQPTLTINRLPLKQSSLTITDSAAIALQKIISSGILSFTRVSNTPWKDAYTDKILNPSRSPVYFGLMDTAYVTTRYGAFSASTINKIDMSSAVFNGRELFEQWLLTKKERREEIMIDPGTNVLAFFADYSVSCPSNRSALRCEFDKMKFNINFNNPNDSGAYFVAAKIILMQDKEKINSFQPYSYPGPGEPPLQSNEKLVGSITSKAKQIILAVWDDAVEDGDTISISINNTSVAKNMLIKKRPQFIMVTLSPGANTILFTGENLGSIPPNTAVLEIIDGKNRKAFFLETVPGEKNLLKIFYNYTSQ
jgi:hypothetical protein